MTASLTFTGTGGSPYSVPGTHVAVDGTWEYDGDGTGIISSGGSFARLFENTVCSGVSSSEIQMTLPSGAAYYSNGGVIFMDSSLNGVKIEARGDAIIVGKEIAGSGGATVATYSVDNTNSTFTLKATITISTGAIEVFKNGVSVLTTSYTDFLSNLRPGMQTYRDNSTSIPVDTLNTVTGGASNTIDSLDSPIRPGKVLNITTTGLDTLTTATTIGGKAIASASAPSGDGTITAASFTNGQTYPAMGSVTVVASDGTNTASLGGQTLSTLDNYATVTIATPVDESAFSLFNAWPEGDPPQSGEVVHYPDDGTGYVDTDLMLVDFATGTHTFWVRRYDGVMYSFTATISESGGGEAFPTVSIQDNKNIALANLGFIGAINDKELRFYLANGANTPQINDAKKEFIIAAGIAFKSLNDSWAEYLRSLGYSGHVSDMENKFWSDGGPP